MLTKFTSLETFKDRHQRQVFTMSWVYAGITAWFSRNDRFGELEFASDANTIFVEDWDSQRYLVDPNPEQKKYFGLINEGHPVYWFDLAGWQNTTLISGHEHIAQYSNGNKSIGFDRWDLHMHKVCSDPRISAEINRASIKTAIYDVLILKGRGRAHKDNWVDALSKSSTPMKILTNREQVQVLDTYDITQLGYEEYFNKLQIDKFSSSNGLQSFFDQEDSMFLDYLPHRRMFQDSAVNAILECTDYVTDWPLLSEKTWKTIINCRPFIIFGDTFSLHKLRQDGFRTFENFCDESYDAETDLQIRMNKSITALHQLVESCHKHPDAIDEICRYNHQHFFNLQRLENKLAMFGKLCLEHLYH